MNLDDITGGLSVNRKGLLPQIESYHLGGVKVIAGRLTFYVGFLNLIMLVPTAYNSSPTLRAVFPNVFVFAAFIIVILGVAAVFEYGIVYPSQLKFGKQQAAKNERDPIYGEVGRLHDRLGRIEAELGVDGGDP